MSTSPATTEDFKDLPSHKNMWTSFTKFMTRGIVLTVLVLLFIGFVTGVL